MQILRRNSNLVSCLILFIFMISFSTLTYSQYASASDNTSLKQPFSDVPKSSYAYDAINRLKELGITGGIGNNQFGYGMTLTRGEFITFLVKLMGWKQTTPKMPSFQDNKNEKKFYYLPIETALSNGVISKSDGTVRPDAPITREEAAVMIVNSLGYGTLAGRLDYLDKPFADVTKNIGFITIARDFGIISSSSEFNPAGKILREQAAAMLIRMLDALNRPLRDLNAFYAISSSSQKDKIPYLSSVCFGWSRLSFDTGNNKIIINTSRNTYGYNDFYLPVGFTDRIDAARQAGIPSLLMVYASQDDKMVYPGTDMQIGVAEYAISKPEVAEKVIGDIVASVKSLSRDGENGSFDGVAIDFEGLRGNALKNSFNIFLKALKTALDKENKKLYVAVHPLMHTRRSSSSIDGYDYRTIGEIADKVILMAHDYDAKKLTKAEMDAGVSITPLTPIEDVYYALEAVTDSKSGVADRSKIMLQISFDWTVWQKKGGKVQNALPLSFNPETFMNLLNTNNDIKYYYAEEYENPYIKYNDPKAGTENTAWYENTRSVIAKVRLARFFGIEGISLWRLGLIPDEQPSNGKDFKMNVWQTLLEEME